jgi:transcriptional regulator with XRE-family HTH domain
MPTPSDDPRNQGFRIYTPDSLGAALRHFREQSGLSQAQLAESVGVHRSYLSELEQGKESEQLRRILRILRQLGVRMTLEKADW